MMSVQESPCSDKNDKLAGSHAPSYVWFAEKLDGEGTVRVKRHDCHMSLNFRQDHLETSR